MTSVSNFYPFRCSSS